MKKIAVFVRIGLGLLLLGIGVADLLGIMPPMEYPEPANAFMAALLDTKYVMFIVSALKVVAGAALLVNRFIPLTLLVFFPITVNMVLFHTFLDFKGIIPAVAIAVLHVYLLFCNVASYRPLFEPKSIRAEG
ncbi:hypothetical protein [Cohnella cellulosilytica]|uniref:DoxX family protein n=1 Tax=Cohnella cellulosilytica TaxID=986710 RepID=A0ABW2FG05_9BACL